MIEEDIYKEIEMMISGMKERILCRIELMRGSNEEAKKVFLNCSYYINSRTYRTVEYTCLADRFGIEIIHGVDYPIIFK